MLDNERLDRLIVPQGATIRDAMTAIDRGMHEIALLADSARRLIAVVTDGDIRRALLAGQELDDPVLPHATTDPFTVGPEASRAGVLDVMRARGVSEVPVLDSEGRIAGLHRLRELVGAVERDNWAVVMAGGRGRRLGRITDDLPKPMVPVAGRPILERIVLHLVGYGIKNIAISVNYMAEVIEEYFGNGQDFGCYIEFLREREPLGTAGSLRLFSEAHPELDEPILVMNGDVVTEFSVAELLEHHQQSGADATIAAFEHFYRVPFGVLEVTSNSRVEALIEKPTATWMINSGIYVLEPKVLGRIPAGRVDMPEVLADVVRSDGSLHAWPMDGDWIDVGLPADLHRALGAPS